MSTEHTSAEAGAAQKQSQPAPHGSPLTRPATVFVLASVSCALWGSAFAFVKLGYGLFGVSADDPASQILFVGLRFALAGAMVIVGSSLLQGRWVLPSREDLKPIVVLSLFQTTLQYVPFYLGLAHASGINASLIEGSSTFFCIAAAALVFRQERITPRKGLGCVLGFLGVALVVLRGAVLGLALAGAVSDADLGLGGFSLQGEGMVFASLVAVAFSACLIKVYGTRRDPVMLAGWQFVVGGATLTLLGLAGGGRLALAMDASGGMGALAVLAYLALVSAVAYSLWSLLLKHNPVSHVAMYEFLIPVFGVLFSAALLGESLGSGELMLVVLSLALIAGGTLVVNTE